MAKGGDGQNKRRKISHDQLLPSGNIRGAFELHNLLSSKQHIGAKVKAGIDEFKNFCFEITVNANPSERDVQLKVLKQYCDEQSSSHGEERDFSELFSIWELAGQNSTSTSTSTNDAVLAAVPAALTQFLRTISSELNFRDFGLSLCQTLLKREQLQFAERGLSAPKSKAFLAIPCIELLSEIIAFDGGAMAGAVFSRRDFIFKRFDALLEPPSPSSSESSSEHCRGHSQRKSTRSHTLRLVLALLRYLDNESKEELISQARLLHACIKSLPSDSPALVGDVLTGLRKWIVDADVSGDSKKKLFNSNNLGLFAQLYDYDESQASFDETGDAEMSRPVRDAIHEFLVHACTSRNGISIPQTGWYPKEFRVERRSTANGDAIDLGLESPYYSDDYSNSVPIKNSILAAFLQKLNTSKDTLQAELTAHIFEHVPELVADYFCKKPKSLGAPRDDAEWRGQFAFVFSVINLPVPTNCGWHDKTLPSTPPPLSVVMESIVPRQLDRLSLNQCLKSDDQVVVISAAKILIAIENKLDKVLSVFKSGNSKLWTQGARMLRETVAARRPNFSEIVAAMQRADDFLVREALFQYMARSSDSSIAYDVGPALQRALTALADDDTAEAVRASLTGQLVSLMKLAGKAKSTTKWASFVQLLGYAATHDDLKVPSRDYLMPKLLEKAVLHDENAFWALITALGSFGGRSTTTTTTKLSKAIITSLDNCINRVSKQPVKYFDVSNGHVSLLACCLSEQWAYITDPDASLEVGLFAAEFFAYLEAIGGEPVAILDNLRKAFSGNRQVKDRIKTLKRQPPETTAAAIPVVATTTTTKTVSSVSSSSSIATSEGAKSQAIDLSAIFHPVQPIPTSISKLTTWPANPDFETELQNPPNSRLASLLLLLSSPNNEFRLSAHATIAKLTHILTLPTCTYSERTSLHLLLGEVNETFHSFTLATTPNTPPLPTIVPSLAIFLLSVITNPADLMYSTANRFLLRSPTWGAPLTRLLPHWTNLILLREPDASSSYSSASSDHDPTAPFVNVSRWLDVLISGLRTEQDMDLYRKSGVFERVCSLYLAPSTRRDARIKILQLVYAGATITSTTTGVNDGSSAHEFPSSKGADTLITRVGIRAWLAVVKVRERREEEEEVEAEAEKDPVTAAAANYHLAGQVALEVEKVLEANKSTEYIDAWEKQRTKLTLE